MPGEIRRICLAGFQVIHILVQNPRTMQQPELGKRVASARRAGGFTQEELVARCGLNVRTLQRIESGAVTPRAYTLRAIADALGVEVSVLSGDFSRQGALNKVFERTRTYLIDLFNLKTHKMRKITTFVIATVAITTLLFARCPQCSGQKREYVQTNSRGVVFLIGKNKDAAYGQKERGDTVRINAAGHRIEIRKGLLFMDDAYVDRVNPGDTVTFCGKTLFKGASVSVARYEPVTMPSQNNTNITYIFPPLPISGGSSRGFSEYRLGDHVVVREEQGRIYLNGIHKGDAVEGDTVELTPVGKIIIRPSGAARVP